MNLLVTEACRYHLTFNANFCSGCGCRQRTYDFFESSGSKEDLTRKYFKYGYNYQTICLFFERLHGIEISLRTLKRHSAQYVLEKASTDISDETLCAVIDQKVEGPLSLKGQGRSKGTSSVEFEEQIINCQIYFVNLFIFNCLTLNIKLFIFKLFDVKFLFSENHVFRKQKRTAVYGVIDSHP